MDDPNTVKSDIKELKRRIDDSVKWMQWTFASLLVFLGLVFGGFGIYTGSRLESEQQALRDFRDHVEKQLGVALDQASLEVSLGSAEQFTYYNQGNNLFLRIPIILQNVGASTAEIVLIKLYSDKPILKDSNISRDEPDYDYVGYWSQDEIRWSKKIPSKASIDLPLDSLITSKTRYEGNANILVQVYYERSKAASGTYAIKISAQH